MKFKLIQNEAELAAEEARCRALMSVVTMENRPTKFPCYVSTYALIRERRGIFINIPVEEVARMQKATKATLWEKLKRCIRILTDAE